ncbi:CRTAC1 family protein [Thalassoroseus pseudoceratinae]|uniref:CRTAC1 family protein n=1 Tax=Thalassoroseus pseudoceratinae TaxID=2713176 RepID=UPI00141E6842|nr:CRTAC1 family protein [Thalassoroseus pseudoceratinae]
MNQEANTENGPSRRLPLILAVALVMLGIGVTVWYTLIRNGNEQSFDAAVIESKKNRATALLENFEFEQSIQLHEEIRNTLQENGFGITRLTEQNLVVANLLALAQAAEQQFQEPDAYKTASAQALEAIRRYKDINPPQQYQTYFEAKLLASTQQEEAAVEKLKETADAEPDNPVFWYELFTLAERADSPPIAEDALLKVHELRPDNSAALIDLIRFRIRQQTDVSDLVQSHQDQLQRLLLNAAPHIREQGQKLLEQIEQLISNGETQRASTLTLGLTNILTPLVPVYLDRARLRPNLLEFVVEDFAPAIKEKFPRRQSLQSNNLAELKFKDVEADITEIADAIDIEVADFNLDRQPDIVILSESSLRVYTLNDSTNDWQVIATFGLHQSFSKIVLADLDRDTDEYKPIGTQGKIGSECLPADLDVILFGPDGVLLLQNLHDIDADTHTLKPMPQTKGFEDISQVLALEVAELDQDGDLDLAISTEDGISLWINLGGIGANQAVKFRDITTQAELPPNAFKPNALLALDFDRNLANDIIMADQDSNTIGILENLYHGRFRWRQLPKEFSALSRTSGLVPIDLDGNSSWDLVGTSSAGIEVCQSRLVSPGVVRPKSAFQIPTREWEGLTICDLDNDGEQDLLAWNHQSASCVRGLADTTFSKQLFPLLESTSELKRCYIADLNRDGAQDVLVWHDNRLSWKLNQLTQNNWVDITLVAEANPQYQNDRNNYYGRGCIIEVKSGNNYQMKLVQGTTTHFGLGQADEVDVVRVLWNNGIPQNEISPQANQIICEKQITKGSCPFLYTWSGEQYEFLTDCLWASPIGLQFAEGVLAPCRHWEYLKIPGDRLSPKNGTYRLMITEELWEACYLDEVELLVVDHSVDVDIYTNEKVASEQGAEFRVHTVQNPQLPVSIVDSQGNDLLPQLTQADGQYAKTFGRRITQGLAPPHTVELDLGQLDDPKNVRLFLQGWLQPTDTSLNIAIGQNSEIAPPTIPSVWVKNTEGKWVERITRAGFPGGKPKTIMYDLSNVFLTDDYRVQIRTSLELYWDAMFFTVDEEPADVRIQKAELVASELSYRGFSKWKPREGRAPETFDANDVNQDPHWPPMLGRFTRYGDVRELLAEEDDRSVVFGAGDAVEMQFQELPPPPEGWTRDFIIHNVGWDKDADLNTVLGQTVEPLPFRSMQSYPYGVDEQFPDGPEHRSYLNEYQTRTQNPFRFWKQISRQTWSN